MATPILSPAKAPTAGATCFHAIAAALQAGPAVAAVPVAAPKRPPTGTLRAVPAAQPERVPCDVAVGQRDDGETWGHLGLRLPGDAFTRWYPVSQEQAECMRQQVGIGTPWVAVTTLNNRALLIQPSAVQRLVLLDADADAPESDWPVSWCDAYGLGDAVYRGLWECYAAGGIEGMHGSPELKAEVRSIVEAHSLGERELHALLRASRLHFRDGAADTLRLDAGASWCLFSSAQEGGDLPALLPLACAGDGADYYAPRAQVALLDMPLHLMRDAEADELAELMASRKAA